MSVSPWKSSLSRSPAFPSIWWLTADHPSASQRVLNICSFRLLPTQCLATWVSSPLRHRSCPQSARTLERLKESVPGPSCLGFSVVLHLVPVASEMMLRVFVFVFVFLPVLTSSYPFPQETCIVLLPHAIHSFTHRVFVQFLIHVWPHVQQICVLRATASQQGKEDSVNKSVHIVS